MKPAKRRPATRKPEPWMTSTASHLMQSLPRDPDMAREFLGVVGKIVDDFADDECLPSVGYVLWNLPSDRKDAKAVLAMVEEWLKAPAMQEWLKATAPPETRRRRAKAA
jgi:hypothetical protein